MKLDKSVFIEAYDRIRPYIKETPSVYDHTHGVYLKWENHQPTHSFKVRGAFNKLLSMPVLPPLLITGSAGNHGQAVALAASQLGVQARVFVSERTPNVKISRMKALGAEVLPVAGLYGDAEARAIEAAQSTGAPFISPYNDWAVIAGAGTAALEWLRQAPDLERLLIPVGGGGLIAGTGLAAKAFKPGIEVIGVLSESSPYLYHQFYHGHMHGVVEHPTLTDGLAGAVEPGSITIDLITRSADGIIKVSEAEIARAVAYFSNEWDETVEGSGAVGLAAVMAGKVDTAARVTGSIISGGNIDPEKLSAIIDGQPVTKILGTA